MKHRRPSILPRVGLALGVLSLLLVGLWIFRIPLAENLLRARLGEIGVPATNLEIASLDHRRIDIRNLWLADGNRLQQGEVKIEWPTPVSPRLATVALTGLELEVGVSPTGLAWPGMILARQGVVANERSHVAGNPAWFPEIQVRDAIARIVGPGDAILAELIVPSFSFVPANDYSNDGAGHRALRTVEVRTELVLSHLRARGWAVTNGVFRSAGRFERRDGQLNYHPYGCDPVSLTGLQREHVAVSGAVAACLKAGGQGPAVVIGRGGRIALDLIAEPEAAQLDLGIAALPSMPLELEGGFFYLQLSREAAGSLVGSMGLRELNLRLPAAGIAFDALDVAATTRSADPASQGWSFTLGARALRHVAEFPALRPLALEGKGEWIPQGLVLDATLRQTAPGLDAGFHLHRDSETGEGEVSFTISRLEFREDGLQVDEVSPLLARHLTGLSGEIEASGRILFNDAWATPLTIAGTGENLVVGISPSVSLMTDGEVTIDFGRSRFDISLPPLSPERGWASLDVTDGGLLYGDVDLRGATGPIKFLSLWPLDCRRDGEPLTTAMDPGDGVVATVVACLHGALTAGK